MLSVCVDTRVDLTIGEKEVMPCTPYMRLRELNRQVGEKQSALQTRVSTKVSFSFVSPARTLVLSGPNSALSRTS